MMRGALCCLVLLAVSAHQTLAAPTLQSVQNQLRMQKVVRGDFRQIRELKVLSRPLESRGRFLLLRGTGLLWTQEQPFPLRITISNSTFRTETAGAAPVEIKAEDSPIVFTISGLFFALFTGEDARLSEYFSQTFQALDSERWQLVLKPIRPPLSNVFVEIRMAGASQISELRIVDKGGDRTRIVFDNVRFTPETLTDEEERAFRP
jgi:hypothetical protein